MFNKMRVVILFSIIALSLTALSLNAEALAVASDYLESNTMELEEGTSRIYGIRIQNPDPVGVRARITYDTEFMKGLDFEEEYIISAGDTIGIQFNITAPEYNKKNNLFSMSYTVHQLSYAPGAGTQFLTSIHKKIKLQVLKNPSRLHINYFSVAFAIILLLIILFLYRKKKHKQKKKINLARKFK